MRRLRFLSLVVGRRGRRWGARATEKMPVHYIRSPVDPKEQVWMVEAK